MTIIEILAILSPIASIAFAFIAFRRNQKSDDNASAREMGQILTEIGYIKSQNDGLKSRIENYNERHNERFFQLSERVAIVEQSERAMHQRMDNYENRQNAQ